MAVGCSSTSVARSVVGHLAPVAMELEETASRTILQRLLIQGRDMNIVQHPDFFLGMDSGRDGYQCDYDGDVFTLEEIAAFIQESLCPAKIKRGNLFEDFLGIRQSTLIYHIGFLYGWLEKAIEWQSIVELA